MAELDGVRITTVFTADAELDARAGCLALLGGDDVKYNAIAAGVMKRHQISTDDLYELTKSFGGKFSAGSGDVHYTREGYDRIAKQVAEEIRAVLPKRSLP